jgi:hypothetical protein
VFRPDRVANVHVFDFRPAIDQHGARMGLQISMGGLRVEVLHG